MALTPTELEALVTTVAERITGTVLGRESAAADVQNDISPRPPLKPAMAWRQVPHHQSCAKPQPGLGGWLYGNRPHLAAESFQRPQRHRIRHDLQ